MATKSILPFALLCLLSTGCKTYVEMFSVSQHIPTDKTVGVAVLEENGQGRIPGRGGLLESALLAFLLQKTHSKVIVLDAARSGVAVIPEDRYSTMGSLESGTVTGKGEDYEKVLGWNEVREGTGRALAGIEFLETYNKKWGLDYILLVWNPGPFHFRAQVVKLETKEIVADVFMKGDAMGWNAHNNFGSMVSNKKAPDNFRYENLSDAAKAVILFAARLAYSIS